MVEGTRAATEQESWGCRSSSEDASTRRRGLWGSDNAASWPIIIIVTWLLLPRLNYASFDRLIISSSTNPRPAAPAVCCITDQPDLQLPKEITPVQPGILFHSCPAALIAHLCRNNRCVRVRLSPTL